MMDERYCNSEVSMLLKELGFDERCRAFWKDWDGKIELYHADRGQMFDYCFNTMLEKEYTWEDEKNIAAPTLAMACEWLRKNKKIHVSAIPNDGSWWPVITELVYWSSVFNDKVINGDEIIAAYPGELKEYNDYIEAGLWYVLKNKLTVNG